MKTSTLNYKRERDPSTPTHEIYVGYYCVNHQY